MFSSKSNNSIGLRPLYTDDLLLVLSVVFIFFGYDFVGGVDGFVDGDMVIIVGWWM